MTAAIKALAGMKRHAWCRPLRKGSVTRRCARCGIWETPTSATTVCANRGGL